MAEKKTELSILIPVYNTVCTTFVRQLQRQAEQLLIAYEIIVADDASTDAHATEENRQIATLPHCRYIAKEQNTGSAATRNLLARESRYRWLLFLDCDMELPDDRFLCRYLTPLAADVVNGGISIGGDAAALGSNLRYRYERAEAPRHTAPQRQQRPYKSFRTTNFLVSRAVMLAHPFDERFTRSGYEDVLFGKELRQHHVSIAHIDNPVLMTDYEENGAYLSKIERSLETLHRFRSDLQGYSRLLTLAEGIHLRAVRRLIASLYPLAGGLMRRNLRGRHPSLLVFKLYRLCYYLALAEVPQWVGHSRR